MVAFVAALVVVLLVPLAAAGILRLGTVPFALVFEIRNRRRPAGPAGCGPLFRTPPALTVVVPAFQESRVIDQCVRSILRSDYPRLEVVCVDDGSPDDTYERMQRLAADHPGTVRALRQENAGKGAALNTGIAAADGEVVVLVDADGIFRPDTLTNLLRGFHDPRIGAVCGNDRPVNLDRTLTCLLSLVSHVGTGLMRRGLDVLGCLPVVSGNIGAYRRDVLDVVGPVRTDTLGEDLELTWRVHRAGFQVAFAPDALVYAESPSTVRGLWRQRVRWARGLLQTTEMHWAMVGNVRYGTFGVFLLINTVAQVVAPFLQVAAAVGAVSLLTSGGPGRLPPDWWNWLLLLGVPASVALLMLSIALDRAPGDLRHVWTLPLWPLYSTLMTFVVLDAVRLELGNAENRWNKLQRTGTVSVRELRDDDGRGS